MCYHNKTFVLGLIFTEKKKLCPSVLTTMDYPSKSVSGYLLFKFCYIPILTFYPRSDSLPLLDFKF